MEEKNLCPICGQPTRVYMGNARKDKLCGKHADALKAGEIVLNEKGLFEDPKTKKILNKDYVEPKKAEPSKDLKKVCKCIACGREVEPGFFFCPSCYHKYKDKKLLIEVTNCVNFELMNDAYEGQFTCNDGHIVKSKSEFLIDNYLFQMGIPHAYERALPIDSNPAHDLHPDFFLPNYNGKGIDVYIEHWGYNENNIKYTESKKYKIECYKKLGITVICTTEKDMFDLNTALKRKLDFFKPGQVNE